MDKRKLHQFDHAKTMQMHSIEACQLVPHLSISSFGLVLVIS